ncbi:laccase-1 precursor [Diplodia corticola]|uniref:Laccase-1 n=1 Tax=Diplodia corticola TaxID=236234 RepID=A0A1J9QQH3_9PEZI|nr:laccase-1 precursor [Diplodia corticola]OJD31182.1 laccase-1 precursor [Diplodia corticola]
MSSFVSKIFTGVIAFTAGLTQEQTNGVSKWGTFDAPKLAKYIDRGNGVPWAGKTCTNANPYTEAPDTGVTVKYDFTIERHPLSPDGYKKDVLLVNGQFPGPLIEANWGDMIELTVHNQISGPEEGTQIHMHGFTQKGTPQMDGVPSVSSCPIAPNDTFVYSFRADLYGTGWYHSHYSGQNVGGLVGPVVVHGPSALDYDIDLGPVLLSDWYHEDYLTLIDGVVGTDPSRWSPLADNNMINGKMDYDCSLVTDGTPCVANAGLAKFNFTKGATHRLRLINGGAASLQHFSIDGHEMTVIANDFVAIEPYQTNVVTLAAGQRSDVLVTANMSTNGAYWMRSTIASSDSCAFSKQPTALAAIYYDGANNTNTRPNTTAWPLPGTCDNDPLDQTVPLYPIPADPHPSTTLETDFSFTVNATGHPVWTVNDRGFHGDYNAPVLALVASGNTTTSSTSSFRPEWNVYNVGGSGTATSTTSAARVVMHNNSSMSHPMHLHGHNAQILASGPGTWDGHTVDNPQNPPRRDVYQLPPDGHLVIQFALDNPGVWPLHCHISWHLSAGMFASLVERAGEIAGVVGRSGGAGGLEGVRGVCAGWDAWSRGNVVGQVDSGV